MDGAPVIGERVAILGQGVVGLLTTALLAGFPLAYLVTLDHHPLRRQVSLALGAHASLDPHDAESARIILSSRLPQKSATNVEPSHSSEAGGDGADLIYELTGDPAALNLAIELCGFGGRVVIGSWYGDKRASVDLGGKFHRSRLRLVSSQVSTLDPRFSGRWNKARRLDVAWEMLRRIRPAGTANMTDQQPEPSLPSGKCNLITHTFPFEKAAEAYRMLDEEPECAIQVVLLHG
jgi:threonine dehydrogenase-like Zn-dependent dehydrogenase